jgi:hypothetical protein
MARSEQTVVLRITMLTSSATRELWSTPIPLLQNISQVTNSPDGSMRVWLQGSVYQKQPIELRFLIPQNSTANVLNNAIPLPSYGRTHVVSSIYTHTSPIQGIAMICPPSGDALMQEKPNDVEKRTKFPPFNDYNKPK